MMDYTKFLPYFEELGKICKEKNLDNKTIEVLKNWFLAVLNFYKPSNDILEHRSVEEYIKHNFDKLKHTEDIKVLELKEILINPNCLLYECINIDNSTTQFKNYLDTLGVCSNKKIELVDQIGAFHVLQHELQHINQWYVYPSEFPFANDMLRMLTEGEAEYHYHLIDMISDFSPIDEKDFYDIYYLIYTILMLAIPKEMRDSWNKKDNMDLLYFSDIFKGISVLENRNNFSHIFALATLIVATCNSENNKEIFNNSIETSINRCSKKVESFNKFISCERELENSLESIQYEIKEVNKRIKILQNLDLLQEKYIEYISDIKEFIASEPKENQEKLLQELQLFTLERFESLLKEEVKESEEIIRKYQNKKVLSLQEILGEENYKQYQYYQFGMELNQNMQSLLSQKLTFTEYFEQLLERVENCLIESKDPRLEEKFAFIGKIKENSLSNSKKI